MNLAILAAELVTPEIDTGWMIHGIVTIKLTKISITVVVVVDKMKIPLKHGGAG